MSERRAPQPLNYQTPRACAAPDETTCWRDDSDPRRPLLVIKTGCHLPDRCILAFHGTVPDERTAGIGTVITGVLTFVAGVAWLALRLTKMRFERIEVGRGWIWGPGKPFLASLPRLPADTPRAA